MKIKSSVFIAFLLLLMNGASAAGSFDEEEDEWADDEYFGRDRFGKNIPSKYDNDGTVSLHAEGVAYTMNLDGKRGGFIKCRINNFSDQNISYIGYSHNAPWHRIQIWDESSWKEYDVGWFCGTGLGEQRLNSRKSAVFDVAFPDTAGGSMPEKIRAGLDISIAYIRNNDDELEVESEEQLVADTSKEVWTNEVLMRSEDWLKAEHNAHSTVVGT